MKRDTPIVTAALAAILAGCGQVAASPAASPTASTSAAVTSPRTSSASARIGWHKYTNAGGAYSLQYPANWYQIPNHNAPANDYPSSFSNENIEYGNSPQVGTPANVFLTVLRDPGTGGCSTPPNVTSSSDTTLGGETAKRYLMTMPPGMGSTDTTYRIRVDAVHRSHCWFATFDSRTQAARDNNAATDDEIIASFAFLD
jgi:hypothetical protein